MKAGYDFEQSLRRAVQRLEVSRASPAPHSLPRTASKSRLLRTDVPRFATDAIIDSLMNSYDVDAAPPSSPRVAHQLALAMDASRYPALELATPYSAMSPVARGRSAYPYDAKRNPISLQGGRARSPRARSPRAASPRAVPAPAAPSPYMDPAHYGAVVPTQYPYYPPVTPDTAYATTPMVYPPSQYMDGSSAAGSLADDATQYELQPGPLGTLLSDVCASVCLTVVCAFA